MTFLALPLLASVALAADGASTPDSAGEVVVLGMPLTVTSELELQAGATRAAYDGLSLPLSGSFLIDATGDYRDRGAMADLTLGADPLGPDATASLRGLEVFLRDPRKPVELRVGRMSLLHGGRFRFVDGVDAAWRVNQDLRVAAWAGAAWHPERADFASGGPTWGAELGHRSAHPLGGGLRYEHIEAEDGHGIERYGADVNLHLPAAAGLQVNARVDGVNDADAPLELLAVNAELRPQRRLHLSLEGGVSQPAEDALPRGGTVYPLLMAGPARYLDGSARLALPDADWTLDLGGRSLVDEAAGTASPGWRAGLSRAGRPGRPLKHVVRLSGLGGPGGTATAVLGELGRAVGPVDVSILGEEAVFRFAEESWRAMTVLGTRVASEPNQHLRLSLLGQVALGQGPAPEASLFLVATERLSRGRTRQPAPTRDRFLSPWSPWRWIQEDMPRSPGTVPGADPYPSIPTAPEADDVP